VGVLGERQDESSGFQPGAEALYVLRSKPIQVVPAQARVIRLRTFGA